MFSQNNTTHKELYFMSYTIKLILYILNLRMSYMFTYGTTRQQWVPNIPYCVMHSYQLSQSQQILDSASSPIESDVTHCFQYCIELILQIVQDRTCPRKGLLVMYQFILSVPW